MSLDDLKNEVLISLKVCKRDEEAEEVITDTYQKLLNRDISREQRYQFWKEIYDNLGERMISRLEDETNNTTDPIITITRDRIERVLEKEKKD